jgi:GntR family transcriptional regulator
MGRKPRRRLLAKRVVAAPAKIARAIHIQEREPIFEISRVRLADNIPILLETSSLSQERFPSLERRSWSENDSLYKILSEEYGVIITGMDHILKPVLLTEIEARELQTKSGTPALLSEIVAFTREGIPVEYSWSLSNGDKSEFYFHFQRIEPDS